ncbi:MAG: DNA-binding domain-containing protein [Vicinamibacteria bacterium]|nr:DNA-binding domain-containing protein [Vicinamibacteria bacterium]
MQLADPTSLRETQACVLAALRAGSGAGEVEALLAPPAFGDVAARWHVYESGYTARFVEALENDFPALHRILGQGPFTSLTVRYTRACVPRCFDLGRLGDRLAVFLETDPLSRTLPFLSDLARLEWALAEAFVAAEATPLGLADLHTAGLEAVADWPLGLAPGAAVIASAWPLCELWAIQAVADEAIDLDVTARPSDVLVRRAGDRVVPLALEPPDAALLTAVAAGARLADLAAAAADAAAVDDLALRFRAWVEAEVIVRRPASPDQEFSM